MKNIIPKLSSNLSKMWLRIINHENCLFPEIKEQLGTLSTKEEKNDAPPTQGYGVSFSINQTLIVHHIF